MSVKDEYSTVQLYFFHVCSGVRSSFTVLLRTHPVPPTGKFDTKVGFINQCNCLPLINRLKGK